MKMPIYPDLEHRDVHVDSQIKYNLDHLDDHVEKDPESQENSIQNLPVRIQLSHTAAVDLQKVSLSDARDNSV